MRQHGFPNTWWTGQHDVVRTGGGHFNGEASLSLPDDVGQIQDRLILRDRYCHPSLQAGAAREPLLQVTQSSHAQHLDAVDQAGFSQIADRDHHGRPAAVFGGQHRGKYPVHRADTPVEGQLPQQNRLLQPVPGLLAAGRKHSGGQGDVVQGTGLGQRRRRQCQGQP